MAVVHKKSTAMTNATATPVVANSANLVNGNVRASQGFAVIASGDSTGSTFKLFRIRSSDRVESIRVYSPDIGTTTAGDLGLYDAATGTVVDADFFCSGLSLNGGALNGVDVTFEATTAGGSIANAEKRVWESIPSGPAADPSKEYDVVLTLTGDADAGGTALFRMQFVSGE